MDRKLHHQDGAGCNTLPTFLSFTPWSVFKQLSYDPFLCCNQPRLLSFTPWSVSKHLSYDPVLCCNQPTVLSFIPRQVLNPLSYDPVLCCNQPTVFSFIAWPIPNPLVLWPVLYCNQPQGDVHTHSSANQQLVPVLVQSFEAICNGIVVENVHVCTDSLHIDPNTWKIKKIAIYYGKTQIFCHNK